MKINNLNIFLVDFRIFNAAKNLTFLRKVLKHL